jgi:hypothetical protein
MWLWRVGTTLGSNRRRYGGSNARRTSFERRVMRGAACGVRARHAHLVPVAVKSAGETAPPQEARLDY